MTELIGLPLGNGGFWSVDHGYCCELSDRHPGVDIGYQLLELRAWLEEDPERQRSLPNTAQLLDDWISWHTREFTPLRVSVPKNTTEVELEALKTTTRKLKEEQS